MIRVLVFLGALFASSQAFAQASVAPYCLTGLAPPNNYAPCSSTYPLPVSASVTASVSGFQPSASGARGTPLSVTTSDSSGNLPTGAVVAVTNVGANPMYCNVNAIAATTSDQYISSAGGWFAFTIPAAVTTLHCIATGGSTAANTVGGTGLPTGTGGGSGGGGGGAVTIADGADVTQGAVGDAAASAGGTGTTSAKLREATALLNSILTQATTTATNTGAAIPDCGTTPCTNKLGSLAGQPDPCFATAKVNLPISYQTTSITQQIALSGSTKIYVCSITLVASAATVFSVTGGTGTNCGTPAALIGTTSATHGLSVAANGGYSQGNGSGTIAVTGAGSELCLVQSGAGDLVGNLTYVQQ